MGRRMRKLFMMTAVLISIFGAVIAGAEEERPTASADIGIFNKYVWRGYELSKDSAVIQPSATVGYKGFGFNLWGNLDTNVDDGTQENQFNETDMTLSYDRSCGPVAVGIGYIYYALDGADDTEELYLSLGYDTFLAPTLTIYREFAHAPAWYFSFGVSHSIALPQGLKGATLDLAGSVGYLYSDDGDDLSEYDSNLNATGEKYQEFHDGLISIGLTIPLDQYFTFSPMIAYAFPLSDEADDHIAGVNGFSNDSDYFFGGIALTLAF
jgi:hypothetical protein